MSIESNKLMNLADGKVLYDDLRQRVDGKADKVTSATNGHFAALDSSGNLTDSGKKASDFASASSIGTVPSGTTVEGQISALGSSKMDNPTNSGTLNQVLRSDGSGGSEWSDEMTPAAIADAVDAWMDDNVPSGTTIAIDRSLTMTNAAAPADLVGDLNDSIGTVPTGQTVEGQISDLNANLTQLSNSKADMIVVSDSTEAAVKSFTDGGNDYPMALSVGIEPVQDLHGLDAPYPPGGGKNKFNPSSYQLRTNAGITATLDGEEIVLNGKATGGTAYINILSFTPGIVADRALWMAISNKTGRVSLQMRQTGGNGGTSNKAFTEDTEVSALFYNTASDSSFSGHFGIAEGVELSNFRVKMCLAFFNTDEPVPGYTPYSNICPITGHTGCEVTRTGKNLFKTRERDTDSYGYALESSNGGNSYTISGTSTNNNDIAISTPITLPAGTYTMSCRLDVKIENDYAYLFSLRVNNAWSNKMIFKAAGTYNETASLTFTLSEESSVHFACSANVGATINGTVSEMQVEFGGTASDVEPYAGRDDYSITFPSPTPGTVYGGTLSVNKDGTGVLTVDRASVTISNLTKYSNFYNGTYASCKAYNLPYPSYAVSGASDMRGAKSNMSKEAPAWWGSNRADESALPYEGLFSLGIGGVIVRVYDTSTTITEEEFEAKYGTMQVVYPLATAATYNLTIPQVKTLLGVNNLWASTGNIKSVSYSADTKLYIDGKLAALLASLQ